MAETIAQRAEKVLLSIMESESSTDDQRLQAGELLAQFRKIGPIRRKKARTESLDSFGIVGDSLEFGLVQV